MLLLSTLFTGCSTVPELNVQVRSSEAKTDGIILFSEFQTERVTGYFLLGRYDRPLPGLFPVEILLQAKQDVVVRPDQFRLKKGNTSVPALTPKQIWASYRTDSLADYPFVFRMVLERPAFSAMASPAWIAEQNQLDTASPEQRRLRNERRSAEVSFQATQIKRYETKIITLLFPLPVPDSKTPYTLYDESNQIPSLTFHYETIAGDQKIEPSEEVNEFVTKRRRIIDRDLHDLFDEHQQLHDHEALREKEKGR